MTAKTIAILGAGQMGGGIAQVCALAGFRADLHDSNSDQLARAVESISRRISRLAEKGAAPKERAAEAVKRVFPRPEIGKWLENADFAVEAVAENAEVKRAVLRQARSRLRKDAVLATNTSSISITELAGGAAASGEFHRNAFHESGSHDAAGGGDSPARKLRRRPVARTESLARELGKTSARAADYPGFITNRILMPMLNEAFFARMENIGGAADIDLCMKLGMRHPMGPLEMADFIGLDTCLAVLRVMHQGFGDPKFRPCPLLVKMVAAGTAGEEKRRGILRLPRRKAGSGGDFIGESMTEAPNPTSPDEDILLTARGISLSFGGLHALKDVSFSIRRREFFSIIGPNGAGKTSLLNCLSGRYRPQAGTMTYGGEDLFASSIKRARQNGRFPALSKIWRCLTTCPRWTTFWWGGTT